MKVKGRHSLAKATVNYIEDFSYLKNANEYKSLSFQFKNTNNTTSHNIEKILLNLFKGFVRKMLSSQKSETEKFGIKDYNPFLQVIASYETTNKESKEEYVERFYARRIIFEKSVDKDELINEIRDQIERTLAIAEKERVVNIQMTIGRYDEVIKGKEEYEDEELDTYEGKEESRLQLSHFLCWFIYEPLHRS